MTNTIDKPHPLKPQFDRIRKKLQLLSQAVYFFPLQPVHYAAIQELEDMLDKLLTLFKANATKPDQNQ